MASQKESKRPNGLHEKVLAYFLENPHKQQKEAVAALGGSAKSAIETLIKKNSLSHLHIVDPAALGYVYRYRVDIWVSPRDLTSTGGGLLKGDAVPTQESLAEYILEKLPGRSSVWKQNILVEDVHILLGSPADLSASIRSKSPEAMRSFVTEGLRRCLAIQRTDTFQEGWSISRNWSQRRLASASV